MNNKPLTTDKEITEFLIQEIQTQELAKKYLNPPKYTGICICLSIMSGEKIITITQYCDYVEKYIFPKITQFEPFLFEPFEIQPRIEFLKEILKNLS